MYVITGATGNTGRLIAELLLANDKPVRVIGRSLDRLQPLVDKGAQAAVGSLDDPAFLASAVQDATAIYAMIPPRYDAADFRAYQNTVGEVLADAIRAEGVSHVVHLSSHGTEHSHGTGPILGLHDQEARLNGIDGLNVLHLRPSYFLENLFGQMQTIRQMGIMGSAIRGDVRIPMIATRDIADYAARRLLALDFTGSAVQPLLGADDYSHDQVATVIGKAIGKPELSYVAFPYDEARQAMVGMGMSKSVADAFVEMSDAANTGHALGPVERDSENTTPTTLSDFAAVFAQAYRQG